MTFSIVTEPVRLQLDPDDVVRVGGTRVTLDSVIYAFQDGATAEQIVQQYPALELADVYESIGYYLRRRDEVEAYLEARREAAERIREENCSKGDLGDIRSRLTARQASSGDV